MRGVAFLPAPGADEGRELAVASHVTFGLDLRKQILGGAPILFGAVRIRFECLLKYRMESGEPARCVAPAVGRWGGFLRRSDPNLRIVLRDKSVRFVISCSDSLSRKYIRRILPNISMVIPFYLPPKN